MTTTFTKKLGQGVAFAALALAPAAVMVAPTGISAQALEIEPTETLVLSQNNGKLVVLPEAISDVFIVNDSIADISVQSSRELYIFGQSQGETTLYATNARGDIVYAAYLRVGRNLDSIGQMLDLAMPEADIQATTMNDLVLLTGTVASPGDAAEAERLVNAYVGGGFEVVSRLRQATPLQVNLQVRIAEVNRSMLKQVGVNLDVEDASPSAFVFGYGQGSAQLENGFGNVLRNPIGGTFSALTNVLGLDILAALDLAETDGFATTLAEPNLTALSGETASFLAGGEFPVPISQSLGSVSIEYRQYGVGLSFTPVVYGDGRISMRVAPEVSELSSEGAVSLNGFEIPAVVTRRAETTIELGSGQSFMIAGLLRQTAQNSINKTPLLGDLPILGSLFRSTSFRRSETELVVVVTPYLVQPVSGRIPLPTDGYRIPNDAERVLEGQVVAGVNGPGAVIPDARVDASIAAPVTTTAAQPGFSL